MEKATAITAERVFPGLTPTEMKDFGLTYPPTQDELPYSDGEPMESNLHVLQMFLLIETLKRHWAGRDDVFVGGNMFVYFSPHQVRTHDFRGPDFFAVQGVRKRERKSWVVWEEEKQPDVVIELLSDSTEARDKDEKKLIYQDRLRVPEYFLFHPVTCELLGYAMRNGIYEPVQPDAHGRLISEQLQLALIQWDGVYGEEEARWLRFATRDGKLLPTGDEYAQQIQDQADSERNRARELEAMLAKYREQFGELPK